MKVEDQYLQAKTEVIVKNNYQNRNRSDNRSNSRDRGQFRQDRGRPRFEQNHRGSNFQNNYRRYNRQNSRGEYRNDNYRSCGYNSGRGRSRERAFSGNYNGNRNRSMSKSRLRSGCRVSTNRDRIRCYNCREYDHFARDFPPLEKKENQRDYNRCLIWRKNKLFWWQNGPVENTQITFFRLMNGRDGTTTFLPLDSKIGGQIIHNWPSVVQFLNREQASYVYKKVDIGELINVSTIQQGDGTRRTIK